MILVKKPTAKTEGTWFDFELLGEKVRLKIRPLTVGILENFQKKHKGIKDENARNERIQADVNDYIIEDWQGFGDEDGQPLQVTSENKKAILSILPIDNEQSIANFVFEKSREIAIERQEALEKN